MAVETRTTHTHLNPFTPQLIQQHRDFMSMNRGVVVPPPHQQQNLDIADNNNNNKKRPVDQLYAPPQKDNTTDQFQQRQYSRLGIDDIIFQQTKRMRREIQERQNLEAIGQIAMNALKEKDEHIQRICKLTSALEKKAKSLLAENQVWRDLAQANEAEANTLRANLRQLRRRADADAESSCGSNNISNMSTNHHDRRWWCGMCREKEACVLILPCRHLCLCGGCGSGSQLPECPVCNDAVKATLHVNMSMP